MSRFVLPFTVLFCIPAIVSGQPSLDLDTPYQLRVVVEMPADARFTPLFRERICREIGDTLQAALGNIGEVEVVTRTSLTTRLQEKNGAESRTTSYQRTLELLNNVRDKGLKQALDEWREISGLKTHFIMLDLVAGRYEIQARQFDGLTGLASPVVRQTRTNDRELVARTAALLAARDFGVVGVIAPGTSGSDVQLTLKAGRLGPMNHWVAKGDVFAIAAVSGSDGAARSHRVPEALLQVLDEPKDGVCRCRLLNRYQDPLKAGASYRCLKLGTTEAKLVLRLVDENNRPLGGWRLKINPGEVGKGRTEDLATMSDGFIRPVGPYQHLALVQVLSHGDTPLTGQIPLEILGDDPVVCRVRIDPEAEKSGQFEYERKRLQSRLDDSLLAVAGLITDLNQSGKDPKVRELVMRKARSGLENLAKELAGYREEVSRLATAKKVNVEPLRERLLVLENRQKDFSDYITNLERVVKEETDPKNLQLKELWLKADNLERALRFDEAIQTYDEFLKGGIQTPEHEMHVSKLKDAWALKDDTHKQARKFVYEAWAKLETPRDIRDNIERAKGALNTFIGAGDRLSPLMLQEANITHASKLTNRLDSAPRTEQDRQEFQIIVDLTPELTRLVEQTQAFLKGKNGPTK